MQFTGSMVREAANTHRRLAQEAQAFRTGRDTWYDGTPHSVDRRLAACNRVLQIAKSAVARSPFDWDAQEVIAELNIDRRALVDLKEGLLTGYADRVAFSPPDPPEHIDEQHKPQWSEDVANGVNPMERHLPDKYRSAADNPLERQPRQGPTPWDPEAGDYAVPSIEQDMTGGGGYRPMPPEPQYKPPGTGTPSGPYQGPAPQSPPSRQLSPEQMDAVNSVPSAAGYQHDPRKHYQAPRTSAEERRWASLEAPKFLRANIDAVHVLDELTTRARLYAERITSGFDHPRPTAQLFVAAVTQAALAVPRPRPAPRTAARNVLDIDPSAMFL